MACYQSLITGFPAFAILQAMLASDARISTEDAQSRFKLFSVLSYVLLCLTSFNAL